MYDISRYPGSGKIDVFVPKNFEEYVGQNRAKEIARVMISASSIESRPLPNLMISGAYGTGKTSLAKIVFAEAGVAGAKVVDAAAYKEATFITKPIIIDEIHNLDPIVADSLNLQIDRGRSQIIGCTTSPGKVPAAFKSRFRELQLVSYNVKEIQQIVEGIALRKEVYLKPSILEDIAMRSRLNPRAATQNMSFIFDWMTVHGVESPSSDDIHEAFETLGIDKLGLTERDYTYLRALDGEHPVGIAHLSVLLGADTKTIEREIEPYLLQLGLVGRMPRGRILLKDS